MDFTIPAKNKFCIWKGNSNKCIFSNKNNYVHAYLLIIFHCIFYVYPVRIFFMPKKGLRWLISCW